jgi:hypothetical protein
MRRNPAGSVNSLEAEYIFGRFAAQAAREPTHGRAASAPARIPAGLRILSETAMAFHAVQMVWRQRQLRKIIRCFGFPRSG